jgi:low density lipoprotein-related protein 2
MFIADSSKVLRANMDGSKLRPIISESVYKANGVAVDLPSKRVYWCDPMLKYIESADYDGKSRSLVIRGIVSSTTTLLLFTTEDHRLRPTQGCVLFSTVQDKT